MKKRILKRIGCSLVILSSLFCWEPPALTRPTHRIFYFINLQSMSAWDIFQNMTEQYIILVSILSNFDFENEKYLLERDYQDILHLKSADGQRIIYLLFHLLFGRRRIFPYIQYIVLCKENIYQQS